MKKAILLIALMVISLTNGMAQTMVIDSTQQAYNRPSVWLEIRRLSEVGANDTSNSLELRKVFTFKVDALDYMFQRSLEQMPDSSSDILEFQAYAMYDFVNLYIKNLGKAEKEKQKKKIEADFIEASLKNPRFVDQDTELTLAYFNRNDFLTRFSLNTDWEKALADIKKKYK